MEGPAATTPATDSAGGTAFDVAGLTDRLEAGGLVERRAAPGDRRVRVLALTEEGERVRGALWERLMAGSPITAGLSREQQRALHATLQQLTAEEPGAG